MKMTTILELKDHVDALVAAGKGSVEVEAYTTRGRIALQHLIDADEPLSERIRRQVECSITVDEAIAILDSSKDVSRASITARMDDGTAFHLNGTSLSRAEDGSHLIVKPRFPGGNWDCWNAAELSAALKRMLADEAAEDARAMRLVFSRRGGRKADRIQALPVGSFVPHHGEADQRNDSVEITAVLVMPGA